MSDQSASQVVVATRRWLKPVIHVLLRCGVTWQEFCDLAKTSYVEVATAKFGKRGRPTNVSRTAMLTGLTRRDVRLQRERLQRPQPVVPVYASKGSQILSTWHLDSEFVDPNGQPALLPVHGEGATFATLLRRSGAGDISPSTVMRELLNARAIRKTEDGRLEALTRSYIPKATDEQLVRLWGTVLSDVAHTYVHNMTRGPRTLSRFERAAKNDRIPVSSSPAFRAFVEREGQAFLERVDAWLAENEAAETKTAPETPVTRMGVGVYQIEDPTE
jgi:hypothetical protein